MCGYAGELGLQRNCRFHSFFLRQRAPKLCVMCQFDTRLWIMPRTLLDGDHLDQLVAAEGSRVGHHRSGRFKVSATGIVSQTAGLRAHKASENHECDDEHAQGCRVARLIGIGSGAVPCRCRNTCKMHAEDA